MKLKVLPVFVIFTFLLASQSVFAQEMNPESPPGESSSEYVVSDPASYEGLLLANLNTTLEQLALNDYTSRIANGWLYTALGAVSAGLGLVIYSGTPFISSDITNPLNVTAIFGGTIGSNFFLTGVVFLIPGLSSLFTMRPSEQKYPGFNMMPQDTQEEMALKLSFGESILKELSEKGHQNRMNLGLAGIVIGGLFIISPALFLPGFALVCGGILQFCILSDYEIAYSKYLDYKTAFSGQ